MSKRIVVALGGNALGSNLPEQMEAVRGTAAAIADLIVAATRSSSSTETARRWA